VLAMTMMMSLMRILKRSKKINSTLFRAEI
jgi:hypothetical protein